MVTDLRVVLYLVQPLQRVGSSNGGLVPLPELFSFRMTRALPRKILASPEFPCARGRGHGEQGATRSKQCDREGVGTNSWPCKFMAPLARLLFLQEPAPGLQIDITSTSSGEENTLFVHRTLYPPFLLAVSELSPIPTLDKCFYLISRRATYTLPCAFFL